MASGSQCRLGGGIAVGRAGGEPARGGAIDRHARPAHPPGGPVAEGDAGRACTAEYACLATPGAEVYRHPGSVPTATGRSPAGQDPRLDQVMRTDPPVAGRIVAGRIKWGVNA